VLSHNSQELIENMSRLPMHFTKKFSDEFSKNNELFSYQGKHFLEIIYHGVFKLFGKISYPMGRNNVVNIIPACS